MSADARACTQVRAIRESCRVRCCAWRQCRARPGPRRPTCADAPGRLRCQISALGCTEATSVAGVRVLLDEPRMFVTYGTAMVFGGDTSYGLDHDIDAPWADESNGLCGAGVPGFLQLQIGTHTGWAPIRVELYPTQPTLDDSWAEIVEVSFSPLPGETYLAGMDAEDPQVLDLPPGDYRVRYSIRGFEEADTSDEAPDSYLLQFWPGTAAAGRIVKQTGERAGYWHRARRTLTSDEEAEDRRREQQQDLRRVRKRWGARVPNERLLKAEGLYLSAISELDIDLEFALAEADDATHRRVAAWATLRSLEQAGLIVLPAIAEPVAALRAGGRVLPPFDDSGTIWGIVNRGGFSRTNVAVPVPPGSNDEESPQNWAMMAIFHSALADSLSAALETLVCLAFVHGRDG